MSATATRNVLLVLADATTVTGQVHGTWADAARLAIELAANCMARDLINETTTVMIGHRHDDGTPERHEYSVRELRDELHWVTLQAKTQAAK